MPIDRDMEKSVLSDALLPAPASRNAHVHPHPRRPRLRVVLPLFLALGAFLTLVYGFAFGQGIAFWDAYLSSAPARAAHPLVARCAALHAKAGPPPGFEKRGQSDRYVPGTRPVLVKNAKIWTGERNGTEVVHADVLVDKGIIKGVGHTAAHKQMRALVESYREELLVVDARGAWVTPGYALFVDGAHAGR